MSDIDTITEAAKELLKLHDIKAYIEQCHATDCIPDNDKVLYYMEHKPGAWDALRNALDRLQAQQSNAEPVAWAYFGDFPDGKRLISADNTNLWGSDGIPLYTHPPASTEPRLTVEQAMEVVMAHDFRTQHPAESADTYLDEMYSDLRDSLTKAAKP